MRASNKIIFLGLVFVCLIFTFNTLPFSGTSASFSDTKYTNGKITSGFWDTPASLIGLPDLNLTAKSEKLNGTASNSRGDKDSISTYESLLAKNSSNNVSSFLNNVSSNVSSAENLTNNSSIAEKETIKPTESSENSTNSSMVSSSGSTTNSEKNEEILPVANFSSNITEGYVPLTAQFTDLSENVTERNWDFGDGDTSSEQDPVHTYSSAGTYEVGLVTNNENGTDSKLDTITVYEQPDGVIPIANFTSNITEGYAPLTVQFTGLSENATVINWDFGDGSTSIDHDPVHTYFAAGNYRVKLTVSNENGTSSKLVPITVQQLSAEVLPVANFSSNVTEGFAPLKVQFTDLSENATEWNWDFGDGDISNDRNPVHTFSTAGDYNVNLTVSNENDTDSKLATITVHEQPYGVIPAANFTSNATEGYAPLTVQFTDLSENVTEWNWDFGDGNNSREQDSTHIFSTPGTYNVNLIVSNENGTSSKLGTITVHEQPVEVLPVANFSSNLTESYAPLIIQFTDLSENATEWNWDFGDGNNSREQDPAHIFSVTGNYSVNLTVSNGNDTDSKLATITVLQPILPVANFTSNLTEGYAPLTVAFTDLSENATEWKWDFGDRNNSTEQNPMYTFSEPKNYTVNLIANNQNGTSTKTSKITVDKNPRVT
jgi:PKD repeat protein